MPNDCIDPISNTDFASRDTNRLDGTTIMFVGNNEPYSDTIDGGVMENYSETMRAVVGEQAYSEDSMVDPVFMAAASVCSTGGVNSEVGSTEFSYTLGKRRYHGPLICVETTRTAFKASYMMAMNSLRDLHKQKQGADIRSNYLKYGGCKLVMDSTATFAQAFAGNINVLGDPTAASGGTGAWPARAADSGISHRALEYLMSYLKEVLNVTPFDGTDGKPVFKFIGGIDTIQGFKDELGIGQDLRSMVSGRYSQGLQPMEGYSYDGPYRGIVHAIDPTPLRFTSFQSGSTGNPILIEPWTRTAVTNGYAARPNSSWTGATYEIAWLIGQHSFERLIPTYQQVAGWDFPPQLVNGQMKFKILSDTDCHLYEDSGLHLWQVARSFKPLVPHAVCAIAFKRFTNSLSNLAVVPV